MFDPYSEWLGLSKAQRPPSLHALLGISTSERDAEAIGDAALLRILQLSPHKKGAHAADYTRLVKEINEAKEILSNPAKRDQYELNPAAFRPKAVQPVDNDSFEEIMIDLTDESTSAPKDPNAWWEEAAPEPEKPKAARADWWKEEATPAPQPAAVNIAAATATPIKANFPSAAYLPKPGTAFDEFKLKPKAPPKSGKGKWIAVGILLVACLVGGYFAFLNPPAETGDNRVASNVPKHEDYTHPKPAIEADATEPKDLTVKPKADGEPVKDPVPVVENKNPVNVEKTPPIVGFQSGTRKDHTEAVRFVAIRGQGDLAVSAGDDKLVVLHKPDQAAGIKLVALDSPATGLFLFPSGKFVAATDGGTIHIIDLETRAVAQRLGNPRGGVRALSTNGDETIVIVGNTAGEVLFWKWADKSLLESVVLSTMEQVLSLAVSADGKTLAAGLSDGTIQRFDANTRKRSNKWKASPKGKAVSELGFSADGKTLYSLVEDNEISAWNPVTGTKLSSLPGGKDTLTMFRLNPSQPQLFATSLERGLLTASMPVKKFGESATAFDAKPYCLDVTTQGDVVAVGLGEGLVQFVRLKEAAPAQPMNDLARALLPEKPNPLPGKDELQASWLEFQKKEQTALNFDKADDLRVSAERFARLAEAIDQPLAARFTHFQAARQQIVKLLDAERGFKIIELQSRWFQIDPYAESTGMLEEMAKIVENAELASFTQKCMSFLNELEDAQRFDCVVRLLPTVQRLAGFTNSAETLAAIEKIKGRIQSSVFEEGLVNEAQKKLEANPNDATAKATVGRFLTLRKREWEKGLALLAKSDNEALKKLAERDLAQPTEAKVQIELGHAWWSLGETPELAEDFLKASCWTRAKFWFDKALATGNVPNSEKFELFSKVSKLTELEKKMSASMTAVKPKTNEPTMPAASAEGPTKFNNTSMIANEKVFKANWEAQGSARLESDGARFTRADGLLTTKFKLEDNWKLVIVALPGTNGGLMVQVHGEELKLPPGTAKASVSYTVERKGTKLTFASTGAAPKAALPASGTIFLNPDKNPAGPLSIQPTGVPAEGLLIKSIHFTGAVKLIVKEKE